MIPIAWHIRIDTLLNIVTMRGEVNFACDEKLLLGEAVDIIENAISLKGVPIANIPTEPSIQSVAVYFSLIFPSANELNKFMENFD